MYDHPIDTVNRHVLYDLITDHSIEVTWFPSPYVARDSVSEHMKCVREKLIFSVLKEMGPKNVSFEVGSVWRHTGLCVYLFKCSECFFFFC